MNFIQTVLAFLLALGPLIVFHELGHYLVARLCGVKVLRFSFGIGRVVWSRRFGKDGTEWAISMFPLGGYVKMLDARDPDGAPLAEADRGREFTSQTVWRRMAIIVAGPLANFLLAILIFSGQFMYGVDEAGTRIRAMPESAAAAQAGLRGGDKVMAVNGAPVTAWSELRWEMLQAVVDKREARLDVERPGAGQYSFVIPNSALAKLEADSDVLGMVGLAMHLPPARLVEIAPGGPAARAGLRKGDVIVAIDGAPVRDGADLSQIVRASGGRALEIGYTRDGARHSVSITPERDETGKNWLIKVGPDRIPEIVSISSGPISAVGKAVVQTWNNALMQLKFIGKMITGELSLKNVTGPITIADYAGQTARLGPMVFLSFIAMVSISLGVMNLLPIPVLDGGHLLYYSLEVLTGRPLPARIDEFAQRAGVGVLVMLMALALFNDVARHL